MNKMHQSTNQIARGARDWASVQVWEVLTMFLCVRLSDLFSTRAAVAAGDRGDQDSGYNN